MGANQSNDFGEFFAEVKLKKAGEHAGFGFEEAGSVDT